MNEVQGKLMKVEAVAEHLGISKWRAYELTRTGAFDDFLVVVGPRQYRYRPDGLAEFVRRGGNRAAMNEAVAA